jgi:cyanophycinase
MITDFIVLVSVALSTQKLPPEAPRSATVGPRQGALVIVGGGQVGPDIVKHFATLAGGKDSEVVVIPTAAENDPVDRKRVGERSSIPSVSKT